LLATAEKGRCVWCRHLRCPVLELGVHCERFKNNERGKDR